MSTHPKRHSHSDKDLRENPLIGGSKGVTTAEMTLDELEEGGNTFEGDIENGTNPQGGIDKPGRQGSRARG
jgi:hypothetical protein